MAALKTGSKRRLLISLAIFFFALSIPIAVMINWLYAQLYRETLLQYRVNAEDFVQALDKEVFRIMELEEKRPFEDYSFYKVAKNSVFRETPLELSPLSKFPPDSQTPGLIGYFQITPEGTLESPVLPTKDGRLNIPKGTQSAGIKELNQRLAFFEDLKRLLSAPENDKQNLAVQLSEKSLPEKQDLLDRELSADAISSEAELIAKPAAANRRSGGNYSFLKESRSLKKSYSSSSYLKQGLREPRERRKVQVEVPKTENFSLGSARNEERLSILSFEGEIDPFQLSLLKDGNFVFFRRVWRDKKRFVQGFIVNREVFLDKVVGDYFSNASIGTVSILSVFFQGRLLKSFEHSSYSSIAYQTDDLFRAKLSAPLEQLELAFQIAELDASGSILVDVLALSLLFILCAGFYGMYRLGSSQIALAKERSDFVSAVSHELKTPLTSIRMYGEMLRSGWVEDKEKRQTYYDYIFHESERLSRLISNVLQLSKVSHSDVELEEHSADVLLQSLQKKLSTQVEAAGFDLKLIEPDDAEKRKVSIKADEDALTQILINLVDNAIKFSKDEKRVDFGYRVEEEVTFFVRDYGPGVPKKQLKKIFTLFYRAEDELTRSTPGTGIGLALVSELAQALGAKVTVENMSPGAEFRLSFKR